MRGRRIDGSTRLLSCLLAALMVIWVPGPTLVQGAVTTSPTPTGGLSVDSDPAGAEVLVDGQSHGVTPVALNGLSAGDHRVRVVKDGYLDNSRIVKVAAGQAGNVRVRLTPAASMAAQVEQQPAAAAEKKGGSKKWLWIGLGSAALIGGGVGIYFATKNDPPNPGTISVSPSGTGMAGITSYSFTSQGASDPDKDPLTYEWDFGDGASGSGATASHTYASSGSYSVRLTVKDKKHSASAPNASVTVERSMAGSWTGGTVPLFGGSVSFSMTQNSTSLGGSMTFSGGLVGTITSCTGSVGGTTYATSVNFTTPSFGITGYAGSWTVRFSGNTDASGTSMSGTMTLTSSAYTGGPWTSSTTFRR
jgi:hypothetical protein